VKLPAGWAVPARMLLIVVLEVGLRTYASRSGLGAVLLSPSGASNDIALFLALLLLLVRLAAIWIVMPLAITWALMNLWPRRTNPPDPAAPQS
jgi:hypothetical protein